MALVDQHTQPVDLEGGGVVIGGRGGEGSTRSAQRQGGRREKDTHTHRERARKREREREREYREKGVCGSVNVPSSMSTRGQWTCAVHGRGRGAAGHNPAQCSTNRAKNTKGGVHELETPHPLLLKVQAVSRQQAAAPFPPLPVLVQGNRRTHAKRETTRPRAVPGVLPNIAQMCLPITAKCCCGGCHSYKYQERLSKPANGSKTTDKYSTKGEERPENKGKQPTNAPTLSSTSRSANRGSPLMLQSLLRRCIVVITTS